MAKNQANNNDPELKNTENKQAELEKTTPPIDQKEMTTKEDQDSVKKTKIPAFLQPYTKAYPAEKIFYVTTDRQVFLKKNLSDANAHQRTLNGEKVQIFNIN